MQPAMQPAMHHGIQPGLQHGQSHLAMQPTEYFHPSSHGQLAFMQILPQQTHFLTRSQAAFRHPMSIPPFDPSQPHQGAIYAGLQRPLVGESYNGCWQGGLPRPLPGRVYDGGCAQSSCRLDLSASQAMLSPPVESYAPMHPAPSQHLLHLHPAGAAQGSQLHVHPSGAAAVHPTQTMNRSGPCDPLVGVQRMDASVQVANGCGQSCDTMMGLPPWQSMRHNMPPGSGLGHPDC